MGVTMNIQIRTKQGFGEELANIIETIFDQPDAEPLYRYLVMDNDPSELDIEDWLRPLERSEGQLCLRFPSGSGAHYIRHQPGEGFKAVYAGPHGPENRPAEIDRRNVMQLMDANEAVEIVPLTNSPYTAPEVSGNAE